MKTLADAGFWQGVIPPQARPNIPVLRQLGFTGNDSEVLAKAWKYSPDLLSAASSASSMWVANAATVCPSADALDNRVEFGVWGGMTERQRRALLKQHPEVRSWADFFAAQRPNTALDMVNRVPGFSIDNGSGARGFEGAVGNVLINNNRPASKNDSGSNVLGRTLANQVERIELIRGGAPVRVSERSASQTKAAV
mgnify:CR=1 FL=1